MYNFAAAFGKPQAVISKEALAEKTANKTGEFVELSSAIGRSKCFPN